MPDDILAAMHRACELARQSIPRYALYCHPDVHDALREAYPMRDMIYGGVSDLVGIPIFIREGMAPGYWRLERDDVEISYGCIYANWSASIEREGRD